MSALRKGLDLLVRPERAEALLWVRLRFEQQPDAREPLFNHYARFARVVAARVRPWGGGDSVKDAEQWAYAGLLQAIDNFDPARGAPFRAFARPRIVGSVRDGFARIGEAHAQWTFRRRRERERLRLLKDAGGNPVDDPVEALSAIAGSLAIGLMLDMGAEEGDEVADPGPSAYDSLAWRQAMARLAAEIERLPDAQAVVIRQHYLNGLAFAQVAELLGLSRSRISQLHHAALTRLRKRIAKEY